ncbi:hypothetical protein [Nonomuraea sp. NPDC050643]|uniref:hypothetical protein n=1 Tax=Nonomuraea sp. NPDC050643 TaxID=3155660 RepID=UPI0034074A03
MSLRVIAFGADGSRNAAPPRIRLQVDTGPPVEATEYPAAQPITDAQNQVAGSAAWMRRDAGVYGVQVALDRPGGTWRIQIENDGADTRAFQIVSLGGAEVRDDDGWPSIDVYCGCHPCACTRHEGDSERECRHCEHACEPA